MKISLIFTLLISVSSFGQTKIPATIEAEKYSSFKGPVKSLDGTYISIKPADWVSYYLNVVLPGSYVFKLKVADKSGGAITQIKKTDGALLGTFVTPSTGSLTNFGYVSDTVTFSIGKQTIRFLDILGEYNLDAFEVSYLGTSTTIPPVLSGNTGSVNNSVPIVTESLKPSIDSLKTALSALANKQADTIRMAGIESRLQFIEIQNSFWISQFGLRLDNIESSLKRLDSTQSKTVDYSPTLLDINNRLASMKKTLDSIPLFYVAGDYGTKENPFSSEAQQVTVQQRLAMKNVRSGKLVQQVDGTNPGTYRFSAKTNDWVWLYY